METITKEHLELLELAKRLLNKTESQQYVFNSRRDLIAFRNGDGVIIHKLGDAICEFTEQLEELEKDEIEFEPLCVRREVLEFAENMEKQLYISDHKGGWSKEHHDFLLRSMESNLASLINELAKEDKNKYKITKKCSNIANYAMMIADNEGENL